MVDADLVGLDEAMKISGMTRNFLMTSGEIPLVRLGRRIFFSRSNIESWKRTRDSLTFILDIEDYAKCFDFSLAMLYRGYTPADWGTGRKREAGQNITNWIRGQLGELALQKFLEKRFGLNVELDFDLHDDIVPQDIVGVKDGGKVREPRIKIAVKSTKWKNSFLILGDSEVELENRKSDIYVLVRIDLPDDHLMRISKGNLEEMLKEQKYFSYYKDRMKGFEQIKGEVVGFCGINDLEKVDDPDKLKQILGVRNPSGYRYVKASGLLKKTYKDWSSFINKI